MGRGIVVSRRGCPLLLLMNLLLQAWLSAAHNLNVLARSAVIRFEPPMIHDLVEGGNRTVSVSVEIPPDNYDSMMSDQKYRLSIGSLHPDIASSPSRKDVTKSSFTYNNNSDWYTVNADLVVYGGSLGKTGMRVRLVRAENWSDIDESWKVPEPLHGHGGSHELLDVWVKRSADSERLTRIFVVSVVILITFANILMGCELNMSAVMDTIKRPVAPAIGFVAQFFIMPVLAYGIAKTVFVSRGMFSMALGLFITGCSPGGGASNFWTLLLDGNVNLSVTMTFISTLASLVMMPLWISIWGTEFLQGFSSESKIQVPYGKITRSLVSLVVPLLIGIAIKKWKPQWAEKSRVIIRPFIIFVLVFVVVFGAISNWYMFAMMSGTALIGGLLLPWCGFMFGCFASIISRRSPADVTAIAIETGIQNTGIAILVLKASFSQPDADIGAVVPVIVACFTPGPLLLGAAVHMTLKRLRKKTTKSIEEKAVSGTIEAIPSSHVLLDVENDQTDGDNLGRENSN